MAVKEYQGALIATIKPTNGSFAIDTSFGTNGYVKLSNPLTECSNTMPSMTSDTSITSVSSTKTALLSQVESYARVTTIPSWLNNMNVTVGSYEGCYNTGNVSLTSVTLNSFTVSGKLKKAASFPVANRFYVMRWVIDPQGRWNSTVTLMPSGGNVMPSSTPTMIRLLADGSPDTGLGANGMKTLTGLPATVTVNGTSVRMNYSLSGLATTAKGNYFVGFATSGGTPSCSSNSGSYSTTVYPYYFSLESGLLTSYGTNGLGASYTYETNNTSNCSSGDTSLGGTSYINSEGRPSRVGQLAAISSQTAGLAYVAWDAADGVIGGGDGTISAASAAGRVDKKVYSTKLPTAAQPDSALTVLTAKQAEDLDIRTSTPKICIALTTSVMMVNPGRCVVRIIDEDTKKVLRTMTTTVKKADVQEGTTLTTDEPIMFKQASIKLSKQAQAQVAELAEAAKTASRVVIIGHSASLGEVSAYSYAISRDRANAVKAALVKAGVKVAIEVVALSYNQPETTKKTEAAQAKNRRAEVFIFP
jgi:outer membrane protein OmpA-like peptidoglycan-associated protein